ncbi:MAG: hypothetical protein COU32_03140 [Candidatus Magasanikbacteria bacterium CG10_big_fil_rev_8_21_14_0_10_42_10]|uniref:Uncharacterized protein n=2 Tax=Candidatus Magasanikiibacteriota TaxID=1752731 RepID=A0A2H0TVQ8_9BACT|nr:MAG: hypothetical protein COU32_03140 [Candidatus Magasanikbacteria bacterium CG10_big_fil_rev_8_21_14_0_10_42_10]PIZ93207.1 MAG: hypothetical protein COX82_03125 [Candidatus Magasanikbacteria bacterium CG_4_10_14_0_2_um_filter_41_10]
MNKMILLLTISAVALAAAFIVLMSVMWGGRTVENVLVDADTPLTVRVESAVYTPSKPDLLIELPGNGNAGAKMGGGLQADPVMVDESYEVTISWYDSTLGYRVSDKLRGKVWYDKCKDHRQQVGQLWYQTKFTVTYRDGVEISRSYRGIKSINITFDDEHKE